MIRPAAFLAAHVAQYASVAGSWMLLGQAALAGGVSGATIAGWSALLAGSAAARAAGIRLQAGLVVEFGARLRRRLLRGALALDPARVRREGTGHLLGRALEAESIEDLAVGGTLAGLTSGLELGLAVLLLTHPRRAAATRAPPRRRARGARGVRRAGPPRRPSARRADRGGAARLGAGGGRAGRGGRRDGVLGGGPAAR